MATTTPEVGPAWETPAPKKDIFSKHNIFNNSAASLQKETPIEHHTDEKHILSDRWIPNWLPCIGRSRKNLIYSVAAAILLLVLILGLGIGLGIHHGNKSKSQNLPLPTSNGIFTGDLTYYSPGPGYGACGYQNTSTEAICAVAHSLWDAVLPKGGNANNNPLCGKKIRITRYDATKAGNRSVDVEVVDKCMGCEPMDLDLSLSMFTSLAEEADGRVVGSWAWLN